MNDIVKLFKNQLETSPAGIVEVSVGNGWNPSSSDGI